MFLVKRIIYEEVSVQPHQLITISKAAELMDMTFEGVISAINRGQLTEITDDSAIKFRQGRRMLVRQEVLDYIARKNQ